MVKRFLSSVITPTVSFILVAFLWSVVLVALAKNNCKPRDCIDLQCYRVLTSSNGPYVIYPDRPHVTRLEVSCDRRGGWIVFQRRLNGLLDFNRTWAEYRNGFGKPGNNMELWLGNENVREVILSYNGTPCVLRVEGYNHDNSKCYIEASNFRLDSERDNYSLQFDEIIVAFNASGSNLMYHRGRQFKTYDRNQGDSYCTDEHHGGWWFRRCAEVFLNGPYNKPKSMYVLSFYHAGPLRTSRMLFRSTGVRMCDNPCEDGGTCVYDEETERHHCVCPRGRCGATCEKVDPCENGGACAYNDTTRAIACVCVGNYTGTNCSVPSHDGRGGTHHKTTHPTSGVAAFFFLLAIIVTLGAVAFYSAKQGQLNEDNLLGVERAPLISPSCTLSKPQSSVYQ